MLIYHVENRPQLSEEVWKANHPANKTDYTVDEREVMDFLDQAEERYGKRCVAYIR